MVMTSKCLLVIDDGRDNLNIYLENLSTLENVIRRNHPRKVLHKDKLGDNLIIAYEETKRMLLLCASSKVRRHIKACTCESLIHCLSYISSSSTKRTTPYKAGAALSTSQPGMPHPPSRYAMLVSSVTPRRYC